MAIYAFCPSCGTQVPENAKFCPSCGNSVEVPQQAPPPAAVQEPVYQTSTLKSDEEFKKLYINFSSAKSAAAKALWLRLAVFVLSFLSIEIFMFEFNLAALGDTLILSIIALFIANFAIPMFFYYERNYTIVTTTWYANTIVSQDEAPAGCLGALLGAGLSFWFLYKLCTDWVTAWFGSGEASRLCTDLVTWGVVILVIGVPILRNVIAYRENSAYKSALQKTLNVEAFLPYFSVIQEKYKKVRKIAVLVVVISVLAVGIICAIVANQLWDVTISLADSDLQEYLNKGSVSYDWDAYLNADLGEVELSEGGTNCHATFDVNGISNGAEYTQSVNLRMKLDRNTGRWTVSHCTIYTQYGTAQYNGKWQGITPSNGSGVCHSGDVVTIEIYDGTDQTVSGHISHHSMSGQLLWEADFSGSRVHPSQQNTTSNLYYELELSHAIGTEYGDRDTMELIFDPIGNMVYVSLFDLTTHNVNVKATMTESPLSGVWETDPAQRVWPNDDMLTIAITEATVDHISGHITQYSDDNKLIWESNFTGVRYENNVYTGAGNLIHYWIQLTEPIEAPFWTYYREILLTYGCGGNIYFIPYFGAFLYVQE